MAIPFAFFVGQWELRTLFRAAKNTDSMVIAFRNNLEVIYITNVTDKCSNHICPLEEDPRRYTQAKAVLTHTLWKLDLLRMLYANWAIYSRNRGVVYTCHPRAITEGLDQNFECWQLPTERGDEGWAGYFLYVLWCLFLLWSMSSKAAPWLWLYGVRGPSSP